MKITDCATSAELCLKFKQMGALFTFWRCALPWTMHNLIFYQAEAKENIIDVNKRLNTSFD